jgi:hypothetical protein
MNKSIVDRLQKMYERELDHLSFLTRHSASLDLVERSEKEIEMLEIRIEQYKKYFNIT